MFLHFLVSCSPQADAVVDLAREKKPRRFSDWAPSIQQHAVKVTHCWFKLCWLRMLALTFSTSRQQLKLTHSCLKQTRCSRLSLCVTSQSLKKRLRLVILSWKVPLKPSHSVGCERMNISSGSIGSVLT